MHVEKLTLRGLPPLALSGGVALGIALSWALGSGCGHSFQNGIPVEAANSVYLLAGLSAPSQVVSSFQVDAETGALTQKDTFTSGATVAGVGLDPVNFTVLGSNTTEGTISVARLNGTTGRFTLVETETAAGTSPQGAVADPQGKFFYFADSGNSKVHGYDITAATGELGNHTEISTPGCAGLHVSIHPASTFLSVACGTSTDKLRVLTVNPTTGALGAAQTSTLGTDMRQAQFHPGGGYLAAVDASSSQVTVHSLNTSNGVLTQVEQETTVASGGASALRWSADGARLAVANTSAGSITMYSFDSGTGALTVLETFSLGASADVRDVIFSPNGKFLFASLKTTNELRSFQVGAKTGLLTALSTLSVSSPGPLNIARIYQ